MNILSVSAPKSSPVPPPSQPDPDDNVKNPKHKPAQIKVKREAKNTGRRTEEIEKIGTEDKDLWGNLRHRILK